VSDLSSVLEDAFKKWQSAEPLVAGRILFESIPSANIAKWSLSILELASKWIPPPTAVERLIRNKGRWSLFGGTYRQHFEAIRRVTLKLEAMVVQSQSQACLVNLCYLAENVAKAIANSTRGDEELEFDEDSGWWIVSCLYDCAKCVGSRQFFDECEQKLFVENKTL
jgi:hypothetical protein